MKFLIVSILAWVLPPGYPSSTGEYTCKVTKTFMYKECRYWDVELYHNNGTPDKPEDDRLIDSGSIRGCENYAGQNFKARLISFRDFEKNCRVFQLEILNDQSKRVGTGALARRGCW